VAKNVPKDARLLGFPARSNDAQSFGMYQALALASSSFKSPVGRKYRSGVDPEGFIDKSPVRRSCIATAAMEQASIVSSGPRDTASSHPFIRLERMPSLRDGWDLRDVSVRTISLSSAKPICIEFYRRTSPIIIIGACIDHFANVRPTIRKCFIFGLERPAARSSQSLYLADCITFTGAPHD
jgi:hypothetical protein